ncbi:MAG: BrnT family toxin [Terriglobales bacterium]
MNLQVGGFDWDDGNRSKCQKHGVPIAEIEALFVRGPRVAPDPKHSADEDRLIAVGKTSAGRPLFVAFTMRTIHDRRLVRPVTARYMHAKEIEAYEKAAYEKESATPKNR